MQCWNKQPLFCGTLFSRRQCFFPSVLCPIQGSWTQDYQLWVALKEKMKQNKMHWGKYQKKLPVGRRVTVFLKCFQVLGDIVYADIQLICNWNKLDEAKFTVWVTVNIGLGLVDWILCVSLVLQEPAKFFLQVQQSTVLWAFKPRISRKKGFKDS